MDVPTIEDIARVPLVYLRTLRARALSLHYRVKHNVSPKLIPADLNKKPFADVSDATCSMTAEQLEGATTDAEALIARYEELLKRHEGAVLSRQVREATAVAGSSSRSTCPRPSKKGDAGMACNRRVDAEKARAVAAALDRDDEDEQMAGEAKGKAKRRSCREGKKELMDRGDGYSDSPRAAW